ncbi:MAG: tetratricopeptide repeat protein, partial [Bacteroidota bacterium]
MYNRVLTLLFLLHLFTCSLLTAQEEVNNPHKIALGTEDSREKVDIYNDMARHFRDREPELAFFYVDTAVELAENMNYAEGEADAYRNRGYAYIHIGNPEEGLNWYEAARNIYDSLSIDQKLASSLVDIGVVKRKTGDYDLASEYFYQALDIAEKEKNSTTLLSRIHN